MPLSLTVRECMSKSLVTFREDTTIRQAMDKMLEYKISGAPVVDSNQNVLGMFSESDALRAILKMVYHEDDGVQLVKEFMRSPVDTVHEDTGLVDVASIFIRDGRRRLPVVNDNGLLVGQVSRRDILQQVKNFEERPRS